MDHFLYRNGVLYAEDVALPEIAKQVGTPFYCYSRATLERHYRVFEEALTTADKSKPAPLICFAVKACPNIAVIAVLARLGAGADVVSEGEMRRALAAGVPAEKIVFSGVGKKYSEMINALNAGIGQFNVESEPELERLNSAAISLGKKAPIAIRVNPDVDAKTHAKISTGKSENKFGIPISRARDVYSYAATLDGIEVMGVDAHIGSQLTDLAPFEAAYIRLRDLTTALRADGHTIKRIDLGGGLGIPYVRSNEAPPLPMEYGAMVQHVFKDIDGQIMIEPGRLIAGNAGILVSETIYVKSGEDRDFLILDAAMNDLIRPAMYEAHHDILPVNEAEAGIEYKKYDIVGPICETGDTFAKARNMAPLATGDLVAFRSAGAYGASMSSEYNSRPLIPEVMVDGDQFEVIRIRPSYDEMLRNDRLPVWLSES